MVRRLTMLAVALALGVLCIRAAEPAEPAGLHEVTRKRIAEFVGKLGDEDAQVRRVLDGPNEDTKNHAAIALAEIGPAAKETIPALQRALINPRDDSSRIHAAEALKRIRGEAEKAKKDADG